MYFPYLRGKTFELLAVKELADQDGLLTNVSPVIEPVRKLDGGSIGRTLAALHQSQVTATVIVNPQVGDHASHEGVNNILSYLEDSESGVGVGRIGVIIDATVDIAHVFNLINERRGPAVPVAAFHRGYHPKFSEVILSGNAPKLDLNFAADQDVLDLYDTELINHSAEFQEWNKIAFVRWKDHFIRLTRNLDYVGRPEELFSADVMYLGKRGWHGISDYQTIGDNFQDGGRLPWAVAIHLTYQKELKGPVYVSHFCSDSNEDASDTARKFGEAAQKLAVFTRLNNLSNPAIEAFCRHADYGTFPGLGSIKRLSIQNHIHVMKAALGT